MMIECDGIRATLWLKNDKSVDLGSPVGGGLYGATLRLRFNVDTVPTGGRATAMTIHMGAMRCTVKADAVFAEGDTLAIEQRVELTGLVAADA